MAASVYNTTGEKKRLGFKYIKNRIIQQKDYYEDIGILALVITIVVCIVIEFISPDFFFVDGMIQDFYNSILNTYKKDSITVFHSVISNKEELASGVKQFLLPKLLNSLVFTLISFFVLFIFSYITALKFLGKYIENITNEIHEDKVLRGTKILIDNDYITKLKELGEYEPDGEGNFITLSGVYEREIIIKGGKEDGTK
jgi:hypothetical protein